MKRLLRAYNHADTSESRQGLRTWYRSELGQRLALTEEQMLGEVLPNLFGYHIMQVGCPGGRNLLGSTRIHHRILMLEHGCDPLVRGQAAKGVAVAMGDAAALPIATDSLDVLLLPHTLEFHRQPHQVLREADRILIPEGHVVILCFNPWSLWGFGRLFRGWAEASPWSGHFFSALRLRDWLELLGFDTVLLRGYFFRPPFQHPGIARRLQFLERLGHRGWPALGGAYMLVARKRVATLTTIGPRWRTRRRLAGKLPEPTLGSNHT